jgi:hypothetical protein
MPVSKKTRFSADLQNVEVKRAALYSSEYSKFNRLIHLIFLVAGGHNRRNLPALRCGI